MTTSVTGKLNEPAKEYPNNSGVNFLVRIGVQVFDFKEKAKVWVNYSGFVFVSNDAQINFYRQALIEGAIVELKGTDVIPEVFGDMNKVTLKVQDPKIGYIAQSTPYQNAPAPQPQRPPQQAAPQQGYQQVPQQEAPSPAAAFEDIPF